MSTSPAFYLPLAGGCYRPTEATIGPWSPQFQHGGPPSALMAHALRGHPNPAGLDLARVTVEILGPVPLADCEIEVRVVRPGKRVELLQAEMRSGGRTLMLAHAWRVERAEGAAPAVPDRYVAPALPDEENREFFTGVDYFPYAEALEWRFVSGGFRERGPAVVWTRARIPLVEGRPIDGVEALLLMLDSANGVSAELSIRDWSFVPVDLTLNLHRHPRGEWLGMDARTTLDAGGIGTVDTAVFDTGGAVGRSLHTLFARSRG